MILMKSGADDRNAPALRSTSEPASELMKQIDEPHNSFPVANLLIP
jgi:hypothetical protein